MLWVLLVLLYAFLKGTREIAKKKALSRNSLMEVLFTYTLISFILVLPQAKDAGGMEIRFYLFIALKSFCIFIAWICSFNSIKKLPVSIYGILDLSRVFFATFLGVFVLQEVLGLWQVLGLVIVSGGLLLLRFKPLFLKKLFNVQEDFQAEPGEMQQNSRIAFYVFLAFVSCLLNAVSGLLDKILMKDVSSSQLQFWYMFFLVLFYLIFILISRTAISLSILKNVWMWIMAIILVISDKALFIANGMEGSRITVMTLIKQFSCIITIAGGKIFFKERNIAYRAFCALVILVGIFLGLQEL